jgi:hypothetical protein
MLESAFAAAKRQRPLDPPAAPDAQAVSTAAGGDFAPASATVLPPPWHAYLGPDAINGSRRGLAAETAAIPTNAEATVALARPDGASSRASALPPAWRKYYLAPSASALTPPQLIL